VLHPEFARQPEVVARFQREAESASSIRDAHVLDVLDVHRTAEGLPYLVSEFLDGQELGERVKDAGKLELGVAVSITRQVCRALSAAHARGIVHRDMKPENVFLTTQNGRTVAKVLDFGISKGGRGDTHLTKTGMIMGTPSYMAPEQARGEAVDLRADVYAVGALLYHLLTGKKPFDSDDAAAVLTMVLSEEPPRPRSIEPSIPEGLELVVQRAMAKDPRERHQSMAELDLALAPFDTVGDAFDVPAPPVSVRSLGDGTVAKTSVRGGLDATARTMMAQMGRSGPAGDPKLARPLIIGLSAGIAVWLLGGFADAIAGVVRYFHEGELTFTESLLLSIGSAVAAATPATLYVRHVKRAVWPNSVKALQLAADLRRTVLTAFATYGALAIVLRIVLTMIVRSSADLANGLWDAGLFLLSVLGAVIAGGLGPLARASRRKANG
jgi:serine/threonine-protein kinase